MEARDVILVLIVIALASVAGYYIANMTQSTTHYIHSENYISSSSSSSGSSGGSSGIIIYQPKITAVVAYKRDCLYCDVVRNHIKTLGVIVRELNVDIQSQYNELLSYLNKLHVEYQGVPTVLIGHYAFFSYQQTYDCPNYATEVSVKIGSKTVKLCRLNDQPNYYIYIPERVKELVDACKATKDPSCFLI